MLSLALVVVAASSDHATAQTRGAVDRLDQAERALGEERYGEAIRLATEFLENEPDHPGARLVRAHALLFSEPARPDDAGNDIEVVLDNQPENMWAQELDLWRDYRHGSSFLLPFRTSERLRRARQIVEADSTRRLAHLVAGLIRYTDFRDSYQSVRFRSFTRPGDAVGVDDAVTDAAAYLFNTEVDIDEDEPELSFRDPSATGFRMDYTSLSDAEDKFAREAIERLRAASGPDLIGQTAHRYLAEVLVRTKDYEQGARAASSLIRTRPDLVEGWMYRGMFRALSGEWEGAERDFEAAFERSEPAVRQTMTSPELFTQEGDDGYGESSIRPSEFWIDRDPLWSTEPNEALIEHASRMVEADLRFGQPDAGGHGWDSDAGEIFVRYGSPLITARYNSLTEGYMLLHYGDRRFMFMVPGRQGSYTFYSPSATEFGGARGNNRQWQSDQVIASREAFREEPRRSTVLAGRQVQLDAVPTRFHGESPATVVAWCMPETADRVDLLELRPESDRPERIGHLDRPEPISDNGESDAGGCSTYFIEAPTADGPARYSLEVRSGDRYGVARFEAGEMGETGETRFMTISDLMPARLVEETTEASDGTQALRRPGHDVYPMGSATFESGRNLYLYFELYDSGASRARPVTLRIQAALVPDASSDESRLERLLGGVFSNSETAPVSVDFEEPVATETVHRYLILRTDDLDGGRYTVAIRVTNPETDRTAQSSRRIEIREHDED